MATATRIEDAPTDRPMIVVSNRQPDELVDEAVDAIVTRNDPPEMFMRAGEIVRAGSDEDDRPAILAVDDDGIHERLYAAATWHTKSNDGFKNTTPSKRLATASRIRLVADAKKLPPLVGVVTTPTLRRDGSILAAPGYDPRSRLFHAPEPGLTVPEIPESPTRSEIHDAVDAIEETLADFPFVDDSDRATALALLLSIVMREVIDGCLPLFVLTARQQGTGKSLLLQALVTIATGRGASVSSMPDGRGAEDELRKRILTILRSGRRVAVLDNVVKPIDSPSLAALMTAERWTDRVLGVSAELDLRNRSVWIATGNNVGVRGDFARRCVWLRLDAKHAKPWTRTGWRHNDLLAYVVERRGDLLAAALTIARGWVAAGMPAPADDVPILGGFEGWRRTIGGALKMADIGGFLGAAEEMYEQADGEGPVWAAWLAAWHDWCRDPVPVAELLTELRREGSMLREVLPADLAPLLEHPQSAGQRIGSTLLTRDGKRFALEGGCIWIERAGKHKRTKAALWRAHRED